MTRRLSNSPLKAVSVPKRLGCLRVLCLMHPRLLQVRLAAQAGSASTEQWRRARLISPSMARGVLLTLLACGSPVAPPLTDPRGLLLVIRGVGPKAEIYALRPDGTESRQLTHDTSLDATPDWSPDGRHIVFIRVQDTTSAASPSGPEIWVMNADGSGQRRLVDATNSPEHPRWSPDGQQIAFEAYDPSVGMFRPYLISADGSNVHALSSTAGNAASGEWSPDGTQLLFLSNRAAPYSYAMYVVQIDGSGEHQVVGDSACTADVSDPRWSPDGARIAYTCHASSGGAIYTIRTDGTGRVPVTAPGWGPAWSPDGRQLALGSSRDGGYDVYIVDMSSGAVSRVTRDGATYGVAAWGGGR